MKISTMRFGEIEIDDAKIISFHKGIPGLEDKKKFTLIRHEQTKPINWLQAVDDAYICLPVVEPFGLVPDYVFDISDDDIADLCLKERSDLHVVSVVVIPEDITKMTVNLAAPILINIRENLGKQIIIDRKDYQIRHPIYAEIHQAIKEARAHAGSDEEGK